MLLSDYVCDPKNKPWLFSGCRKRGVEFKGGSLHDGFGGFDGSGKLLALLLLVLQNTVPRGSRDGFGGFGGCGDFGRDGYPQHFYFSHRPSPLLRGRHLSGSWGGSVLSRFSVGFWSVLVIFDRN